MIKVENMEERGKVISRELERLYSSLDMVKRDRSYKGKLVACSYMHHRDGYEGTEVARVKTYDSSAQSFFQIVRDGIVGYITPQDKNWAELVPRSGVYGEGGERRKYFFTGSAEIDGVQGLGKMLESWASSVFMCYADSNYYDVERQCVTDALISGTGYMAALDEFGGNVTYRSYDPQTVCIASNDQGTVEVFARKFRMEAKAFVRRYGDSRELKASKEKAKGYMQGGASGTELIEAILPKDYLEGVEVGNGKRFAHVLYSVTDSEVVFEGGFEEFPVCAYRFDRDSAETEYGTGLVERLVDTIRQLDELSKGMLTASQRAADPPMDIPPVLEGKYSTFPGAQNVVPDMTQRPQPSVVGDDFSKTVVAVQDLRQSLRSGMKVDMFLTVMGSTDSRKTAFEVSQLKNEATTLLSIMVDTMVGELIWPMFRRTLEILNRKGMLAENLADLTVAGVPGEVMGNLGEEVFREFLSSLRLEMNSVFVQRLNAFTQYESISATMGVIQGMQAIFPGAAANFDMNLLTRYAASTTQVPRGVMKPLSEVKKMQQQAADMQKRQVDAEASASEGKALSEVAKASSIQQGGAR